MSYLTAAQWSDSLYIIIGLVIGGTILAVGFWKYFTQDWSDSI